MRQDADPRPPLHTRQHFVLPKGVAFAQLAQAVKIALGGAPYLPGLAVYRHLVNLVDLELGLHDQFARSHNAHRASLLAYVEDPFASAKGAPLKQGARIEQLSATQIFKHG